MKLNYNIKNKISTEYFTVIDCEFAYASKHQDKGTRFLREISYTKYNTLTRRKQGKTVTKYFRYESMPDAHILKVLRESNYTYSKFNTLDNAESLTEILNDITGEDTTLVFYDPHLDFSALDATINYALSPLHSIDDSLLALTDCVSKIKRPAVVFDLAEFIANKAQTNQSNNISLAGVAQLFGVEYDCESAHTAKYDIKIIKETLDNVAYFNKNSIFDIEHIKYVRANKKKRLKKVEEKLAKQLSDANNVASIGKVEPDKALIEDIKVDDKSAENKKKSATAKQIKKERMTKRALKAKARKEKANKASSDANKAKQKAKVAKVAQA